MTEIEEKIKNNLNIIKEDLNKETILCAVTKYHNVNETKAVINQGITNLGENKVQDLLKKQEEITEPVNWHFIGHLQTNKVKQLIGKVSLIQSVDSIKLLKKIDFESKKKEVISDILIQYNLTGESQKYGFEEKETENWINEVQNLENIRVKGIMGMGPHTDDKEFIREVFKHLKELYDKIAKKGEQKNIQMTILSMGMSNDYPIALEEGANLVRIGSKIFN